MTKAEWKSRIISSCEGVGTYKREFDDVIETLATILEQRDKAMEAYEQTGGHPVVVHTNKVHEKNYVKNPMLVMWSDLNKDALAYWRDLGLTPSGLRKIDDQGLKSTKKDGFEAALAKLEI